MSAARKLGAGAVVGKFALVREVGRGGMCAVFEARHTDLDMRVAVKVLLPRYADNPTVVERFLREGRAASRINHRNAIRMVDVGRADEVVYLAMEYLEGEDLARRLRDRGALAPAEAADLMLPVTSVIAEAHAGGVIHRDIKPANVFLAADRFGVVEPKVLDFGISKIEDDVSSTAADMLLGTPHFMAPEQFGGSQHASAASDQYALGVMLYQCVTGRLPFRGDGALATYQAIVAGRYAPPREVVAAIPEGLEAVIVRAMALDPAQRFASVTAFAAALLPFASPDVRALWSPRLLGLVHPLTAPGTSRLDDTADEASTSLLTGATTPMSGDRPPWTSEAAPLPVVGPSPRVLTVAGVAALSLLVLAAVATFRRQRAPATTAAPTATVVVRPVVPSPPAVANVTVSPSISAPTRDVPAVEPATAQDDTPRVRRRRVTTTRNAVGATRDPSGAIVIR